MRMELPFSTNEYARMAVTLVCLPLFVNFMNILDTGAYVHSKIIGGVGRNSGL